MNSSRDFKKTPHLLPPLKNESFGSPLRRNMSKKETMFHSITEGHSKFKPNSNADINFFNETLGILPKQNSTLLARSSIKFAGSEILKTFNFALNPVL